MTSRARLVVLLVSVPLILLVLVGGVLSRTMPPRNENDSYQHLRVFDDVVSLVMNNYVEQVESDKIMSGAMRGLAEGLDPDCAWLTSADVAKLGKGNAPKTSIGIELTRQYYLRVIAARDDSPAAKAGIKAGDRIVKLAGREVHNVYDYTYALGEMKAGQEYEVELLRAGERLKLKLIPAARR